MKPIKLREGYTKYGADYGRPAFLPADPNVAVKLRMIHLKLDSGGYDPGGAYFGLRLGENAGSKIYWAESIEAFPLAPFARPDHGTIELSVDAYTRKEAKEKIRKLIPNATFYR